MAKNFFTSMTIIMLVFILLLFVNSATIVFADNSDDITSEIVIEDTLYATTEPLGEQNVIDSAEIDSTSIESQILDNVTDNDTTTFYDDSAIVEDNSLANPNNMDQTTLLEDDSDQYIISDHTTNSHSQNTTATGGIETYLEDNTTTSTNNGTGGDHDIEDFDSGDSKDLESTIVEDGISSFIGETYYDSGDSMEESDTSVSSHDTDLGDNDSSHGGSGSSDSEDIETGIITDDYTHSGHSDIIYIEDENESYQPSRGEEEFNASGSEGGTGSNTDNVADSQEGSNTEDEVSTSVLEDVGTGSLFSGETFTESDGNSDDQDSNTIRLTILYLSGENQDIAQTATGLQNGLEISYPTTQLRADKYGRFSVQELQGYNVINHNSSMTYCSYASFLNLDILLRAGYQNTEYTIVRGDAIALWNQGLSDNKQVFTNPRSNNEDLINALYNNYDNNYQTIFDMLVENTERSGEVMGYHRFTVVIGDDDQLYVLDAIRMHSQAPLLLTQYIETYIRDSEDLMIMESYDIHHDSLEDEELALSPLVHTPLDFLPFVQNGDIVYSPEKQTISFFTGLIYASEDMTIQAYLPAGLVISALSGEILKLSQFSLDLEDNSDLMSSFQFGIPNQHIIFSQPIQITNTLEGIADDAEINVSVQHAGEDQPAKVGLTTHAYATCNLDGSVNAADQLDHTIPLENQQIKFWSCGASIFYLNGLPFDDMSIVLQVDITSGGQTLTINKYFNVADYEIDRGDGSASQTISGSLTHSYSTSGTYYVELKNPGGRWRFTSTTTPLVPQDGTTADNVEVFYMPSLKDWFGDSGSNPGTYFFYYFNQNGALTSLPAGSFDTSNITTVGTYFFTFFNSDGALTSLPAGSFDTSNITTARNSFFSNFNRDGALTSLPAGSFDTSNITTVGNYFFRFFNRNGALTSLPAGSFDISNITSAGTYFFYYFNRDGALTSLPAGSFDTSNITTVGSNFFTNFNTNGALTKSPRGVKIKNVTNGNVTFYYKDGTNKSETVSAGNYFDSYTMDMSGSLDIILEVGVTSANQTLRINKYFNVANYTIDRGDGTTSTANGNNIDHTYSTPGTYYVTLKNPGGRWLFNSSSMTLVPQDGTTADNVEVFYMPSLKDWFGDSASSAGSYFFSYFNYNGALTSLPADSFDTSNITTVGNSFFAYFNRNGALTSLPAGSFDISNITTAGSYFFRFFNRDGALTSLPAGSFDISNITTAGSYFFAYFNRDGALTSLPAGSFDTSNITTVDSNFFAYFNRDGALTSLPAGSFDTSNITSAGGNFFYSFNNSGALSSLPAGSFDISNITTAGSYFFTDFNYNGALTKSPRGVKIKNVTNGNVTFYYKDGTYKSETVSAGNYFDSYTMDMSGSLDIILEVGVTSANQTLRINKYFNVANYTIDRGDGTTSTANGNNIDHTYSTPGTYYVTLKNPGGRWLFNSSSMTLVPQDGTTADNVAIVAMPSIEEGFGTSSTNAGDYFFYAFNTEGALTSLPDGSFDTSNITSTGTYFFYYFNQNGALTSLPAGSFDTSNITTAGSYFFAYFNYNGALTSLPEGSFDTSNITTAGSYFFTDFNYNGALTKSPRGVKIKNVSNGNVTFYYKDGTNKSETVSAGNYFDSYTMDGFLGFPPHIAGPISIDLGSTSTKHDSQFLSGTSDYFSIEFISAPYSGYYTTLEMSDLVSTGSIIGSGNIYLQVQALTLLSGDANPAVSIDAGLLSSTNAGSGPLNFITKTAGTGAGITGVYGSKLNITIDLPAYQSLGVYTGTITYTLYEED